MKRIAVLTDNTRASEVELYQEYGHGRTFTSHTVKIDDKEFTLISPSMAHDTLRGVEWDMIIVHYKFLAKPLSYPINNLLNKFDNTIKGRRFL